MKKAIAAIVLCVALISCMSLSTFAESYVDLFTYFTDFYTAKVKVESTDASNPFDSWVESSNKTFAKSTGGALVYDGFSYGRGYVATFGIDLLDIYPTTQYAFRGFDLDFRCGSKSFVIDPGYYVSFKILGLDQITLGSYLDDFGELYFSVIMYDNAGQLYTARTSPVFNSNNNSWYASLQLRAGDGDSLTIERVVFKSNLPSGMYGKMFYDVQLAMFSSLNPTLGQLQHEQVLGAIDDATDDITKNQDANTNKIIANDDENTNKITDSVGDAADDITANQNANTDKIIANENANHEDLKNGWDSPDGDPAGDVDDLTGNMGDAEKDALGGKTDAEIEAELSGLISSNSFPGPTSSGMVSSLFDKMLKAFGNEYQAVLMLSLVLGLAAFLVGRQYRAKGD